MDRPDIIDLMAEPDYPLHDTVTMSIRHPNYCSHQANEYCKIEEPHHIEDCNYWQDLDNK